MTQKTSKHPLPTLSRRRLWIFRILLFIIFPLLLLLLLETGLRLGHYGFSTQPFQSTKIDHMTFICDNPCFSWSYFPPKLAREFDPFIFPENKADNTFRVFILGSSPAQGVPDGAFSFGRILEVMLRKNYPTLKFEIINTAITAINSHVVRQIAKECRRYQPDLFIVYTGNNEVVGPSGPGTVFTPFSSRLSAIRLGIEIKNSKIGQLASTLLQKFQSAQQTQQWSGLEMFSGNRVAPQDARLKTVYRHFQQNLEDVRQFALDSHSNIIFCTIANNLKDCPPFASMHRPGLTETQKHQWQAYYHQGIEAEEARQYSRAIEQYLLAAKIDHSFAGLHFRLGVCYWQSRQYAEAREAFLAARENDALRFRADQQINDLIRKTASPVQKESQNPPVPKNSEISTVPNIYPNVYLADMAKTFERQSQHHIPGKELFYEHVHMTFHGNYVFAWSLYRQVQHILASRFNNHPPKAPLPPTEKECRQSLAYTLWEHANTLKTVLYDYIDHPPYTGQLYHAQRVKELEQQIQYYTSLLTPQVLEQIGHQYSQAIDTHPSDPWLRKKFAQHLTQVKKDYSAALEQYRMLSYGLPHSYEGYAGMAYMYYFLGQYPEAIQQNLNALQIHPYKPDVINNLALAYQMNNQSQKAIQTYKRAIQLRPQYLPAQLNLVRFLITLNRKDEALNILKNALKSNPDSSKLQELSNQITQSGK